MLKWKKKKSGADGFTEKRSIHDPNEVNTSVEIPMYAPNIGLMPKEYQISPQLNNLEINFKELCMDFLKKANPDEFNSSYMDAVIERICVDAISFLKVQRCDHERLIRKVLDVMHQGDYVDARNKLQYFMEDKEENAKELRKYRRIYWAGTSLEEEDQTPEESGMKEVQTMGKSEDAGGADYGNV